MRKKATREKSMLMHFCTEISNISLQFYTNWEVVASLLTGAKLLDSSGISLGTSSRHPTLHFARMLSCCCRNVGCFRDDAGRLDWGIGGSASELILYRFTIQFTLMFSFCVVRRVSVFCGVTPGTPRFLDACR